MTPLNQDLETHEYAYLTTVGRRSGSAHRIEIWFVIVDRSVWVNSGGRDRSDWVRNLIADPRVELEIGSERWPAAAWVHPELTDHPARERLAARYQGWRPNEPLSTWATSGLLVEVEVTHDR
ncbi:MAG: nitroreductase family deazaflavin-dependent oxidoreductase [Actinomycetota bacterium]